MGVRLTSKNSQDPRRPQSTLKHKTTARRRLHVLVARHRRGLAALLAALAVLLVASPGIATTSSGREVIVAARPIEGGRTIQRSDLRTVRVDPAV
ncbi:hypothetical protein H639_08026, partial [Cutibacterium avidum TM16]